MRGAILLLFVAVLACDGRDAAADPLGAFGIHAGVLGRGDPVDIGADGAVAIDRSGESLVARIDGLIELRLAGHQPIHVREHGARGGPRPLRSVVAIPAINGTSYWTTARDHGFEEWLDVRAGAVTGSSPIATWSLEGASFRSVPGRTGVHVVSRDGAAIAYVDAPIGWTTSGATIRPKLAVEDGRLALYVPSTDERILVDPIWVPTGSMSTGHMPGEACVEAPAVPGGVLVAGGGPGLTVVERYDVVTGVWSTVAPLTIARSDHTVTRLADGRVLVAGGDATTSPTATAELYDPALDRWTPAASMATARDRHTATLLADGRVLVVGGITGSGAGTILSSAEIYDPATDSWTTTASIPGARWLHEAVLLTDGSVLVAGGVFGGVPLSTAARYVPATGTWSALPNMSQARGRMSATRLLDGSVLVAGGLAASGARIALTELYDPTANRWTATGNLRTPRADHVAVLLADGTVRAVAGLGGTVSATTYLVTTELFDPSTGTWSVGPRMMQSRFDPFFALLTNGRVLVAGGETSAFVSLSSTEILVEDTCGNGSLDPGEACDDGNHVGGDCCSALCAIEPTTTTCRAATSVCDVAERCDGTTPVCPADVFGPSTIQCRASVGECDVAETCTGTSSVCPTDAAEMPGTPCGPAPIGPCDAADECGGTVGSSAMCTDLRAPAGTTCSAPQCSTGVATGASACDGITTGCPVPAMTSCAPYTCGASTCLSSCGDDSDCLSGFVCVGMVCARPVDAAVSPVDAAMTIDAAADDAFVDIDAAVPDAALELDTGSSRDASSARDAGTPPDAHGSLDAGSDSGARADAAPGEDAALLPAPMAMGCGCAIPSSARRAPISEALSMAALVMLLRRRARARSRSR